MTAIQLLEEEILYNKKIIKEIQRFLPSIIDIQEKNEDINRIEDLQASNINFEVAIQILSDL